jgi:hypothetical protein
MGFGKDIFLDKQIRRFTIRWKKKIENYLAILHFACVWITLRASGFFGSAFRTI